MLFARTKKYVGLFLALSIVFGCLIFIPDDVKADAGIALGETYSITEEDYKYQFYDYCASVKFVPQTTGYYMLSGTIYLEAYSFNAFEDHAGSVPLGFNFIEPEQHFKYFNIVDLYNPDMQEVYYLEAGREYYFIHSKDGCYGVDYGQFCFRFIEDYISITPHCDPSAVKDNSFSCWIETETCTENFDFDAFKCTWYTDDLGMIQTDNNLYSTLIMDSNVFFDENDFVCGYGDDYIYCKVEYSVNGISYTDWIYNFNVEPRINYLDATVWAEAATESDEYIKNFDYSGKCFIVNAGTSESNCNISYQWYLREGDSSVYEPMPGMISNQIQIADLGDTILYKPYSYWLYRPKYVYCEVTFDNGVDVATRRVNFDVSYGIHNDYVGTTSITANYGDIIVLGGDSNFTEPFTSEGFTYHYVWTYERCIDDGWDNVEFGNTKTVTIDTSLLPVYHNSEGDYSEVYCDSYAYYDGYEFWDGFSGYRFMIYFTDSVTPDTSGIAVNSTNFPDERFRQYVSDNIDVNKSGYLSNDEIQNAQVIDVSNEYITSLEGIRYFSNLKKLYCGKAAMHSLDLSGLANLTELRCDNLGLDSIDLSGCRSLKIAYFMHNCLESINIDDCPYLMHAYTKGPQTATMAGKKFYGVFENCSSDFYDLIFGLEMDEETVVEGAEPFTIDTELKILTDPRDFEGPAGETAIFKVVANAENVVYQWQYMLNDTNTWINCTDEGFDSDTLYVPVVKELNGCKYRCLITDGNEIVQSDYARIFVITYIPIYEQPVDYIGLEGSTATFNVVADGEGITYQWQLKKGKTWANLTSGGATTSTLSVKTDSSKNGKVYRCLITDENGHSVTTDEVSITIKEPSIKINTQPQSFSGPEGSTAKFTVAAEGEGLTYQWQLKKGSKWANLTSGGATTSTMSIKVDASKNGKVYRCLVTDANGEELATKEVSITVKEPDINIVNQPASYVGTVGSTATFNVVAEGENLTYQWQLKKGSKWANLSTGGATTSTMTIKVDESKDGKVYRCLITNAAGEELATNEVSITVKEPDIIISEQPINQYAIENTKVSFHVEAEGEGLTYQWQLKKGKTWANLTSGGATTDTMTIKVDSGKFGKVYRCVITNSAGEQVVTDEVTIYELTDHTNPPIFDDPTQPNETTNKEEGPIITPVDPVQPNNASEPVEAESPAEVEVPAEVTEPVQAPAPVEAAGPAAVETPEAPVEQAE